MSKHSTTRKHSAGSKHGHAKKRRAQVVGTHHKHAKASPPKKGG